MSRFLLRLYPRAWRERYGEEFLALIEAEPSSARLFFDVFRGALREQTRPVPAGIRKFIGTAGFTIGLIAVTFPAANLLFRFFQLEAHWLSRVPGNPAPLALVSNIVAIGAPFVPMLPIADRYGPVAGTTIRNALWIGWIATIVATPIAIWSVPVRGLPLGGFPWLPEDVRANPLVWLVSGSIVVWLRRIGIEPPYRRWREYGPKPPILDLR